MTTENQLLREAVFTVLEGFTIPHDVRTILETAYYAALTQPAQPAEGGEVGVVKMAAISGDFGTVQFFRDVEKGTKLYTAPPASQEQAQQPGRADLEAAAKVCDGFAAPDMAAALRGQQPSGGEVVAWTESKPKKPGVYGWRGSPASYDMVHVHTRPTEHSPGGQLNGSCLSGKGFYHGCAITSWGGEWIGPLDTLTLATPKPEPRRLGLVRDLLKHIEQNTCTHEETHRGGAIWEICNACGSMWADDKGGKPEFVWPDVVERAREYLAHHRITKGEA